MSEQEQYDVVIVGGGTAGALIAKRLTHAKLRVLVLEAGPATPATFDGYTKHLEHFYAAAAKGPESPWPRVAERAAARHPRPPLRRRLLRPERPAELRQQLHAAPGRLHAALARRLAAHAARGLRAALAPRRRSRLAARLRGPRALLQAGRVRARRGRRRGRPGPSRRRVRSRLRLPDASASRRATRTRCSPSPSTAWRSRSATTPSRSRSATTPPRATRCRAATTSRSAPSTSGAEARRSRRDLGQRCAGNTACTPICPIQAKYNAAKTLAQADARAARGARPGRRVEDPRRSRQRRRSRASSTSATTTPARRGTRSTPRTARALRAGGPRRRERQAHARLRAGRWRRGRSAGT